MKLEYYNTTKTNTRSTNSVELVVEWMFLVGNYPAFTNFPASVLFLGQRHFENGLTKSLSARWVM